MHCDGMMQSSAGPVLTTDSSQEGSHTTTDPAALESPLKLLALAPEYSMGEAELLDGMGIRKGMVVARFVCYALVRGSSAELVYH